MLIHSVNCSLFNSDWSELFLRGQMEADELRRMEVVQEVEEGSPHATSLAGTATVSSRLLSPVSALFIITDSVVD